MRGNVFGETDACIESTMDILSFESVNIKLCRKSLMSSKTPTTFPLFPNLPVELQLMVWDIAFTT